MKIETIAAQATHKIDPATGAVAPPIYLSTTFERDEDGEYPRGYTYSRSTNPNREALEECLALLEGGASAAAFSSGMAAISTVFMALSPGDHVVLPNDCYHGTTRVMEEVFSQWGLASSKVDMSRPDQVREAVLPNTRVIWVETPSNPLLKITDLGEIAEIAHHAGAMCVCDNTWPSPLLQQPLALGADLAMHSTTKYLGGHEDVMGGALVAREENDFFRKVRLIQNNCGAVLAPFDSWLTLRGIRTLHLRMTAHSANAMQIARFLQDHSRVEAVHYPGLEGHPGHAIASRQMSGFGGMLSFQVQGGKEAAMQVAAGVRLFVRATSLGGTQSLIEHRASIEGATTNTPKNLLRVSVGLENAGDLIEDLSQALDGVGRDR
ncbi:MAG: aminotransferase class V-fold PLP-dependent enzyme [Chloroflexi bacterium]|nr:aminotransferase class V-fold PLP-dependent enzyme [Chloroflexota bacterium]